MSRKILLGKCPEKFDNDTWPSCVLSEVKDAFDALILTSFAIAMSEFDRFFVYFSRNDFSVLQFGRIPSEIFMLC